jgi:acetyl esterase
MIYNFLTVFEDFSTMCRKLSFEVGFCAGVSTMVGYLLYSRWNSNLSAILNLSDVYFAFKPKKYHLKDCDTKEIREIRCSHEKLPMGSSTPIKSSMRVDVPSTSGGPHIPIFIYSPNNCEVMAPIVVYIHGGGFVVGTTKMYEPIITYTADKTKSIVIGIDYRKAPEDKFPAGVHDCLDAIRWIHANASTFGGNASKIVVAGDSAGGNLTIIASLELSDIVRFAIPIYPVVYFGMMSESKLRNADAPILKSLSMDWYNMRYFRTRSDLIHPLANPLERPLQDLRKAPRTHIITAEYDPLLDEGIEYAKALKDAGVTVTYKNYDNTVHGFFGSPLLTHGRLAMDDVCDILNSFFAELK